MLLSLLLEPVNSLESSSILDAYHDDAKAFEEWRPSVEDVIWTYSAEGWAETEPDVRDIDLICGALLDLGDLDVLSVSQCKDFSAWLAARLQRPLNPHLQGFYSTALKMSRRAIELDSALIVEF